jgi:hypothetical protein
MVFLEKYGTAIAIVVSILAVLGLTPIGAVIGRLTMLGAMALLAWLACRLLLIGDWKEKSYWQYNLGIGVGVVFLGAITAFVLWADPRMPNLSTGECRVSRYEPC